MGSNEPIKVKVTEFHIKNGKREDCSYCPIALAIADTIQWSPALDGPFWKIIKVHDHLDINIRGKRHTTSKAVSDWIEAFDGGLEVKPIEFTLTLHEKDEVLF